MKYIITITGKTCSGKTTLESKLCSNYGYNKVISTTSREPRHGEVDGVDYHFVGKEYYEQLLSDKVFVEHVEFMGNYYGMAINEVLKSDKPSIVVMEPIGVNQVAKFCSENEGWRHISFFLDVSSQTQAERFIARDFKFGYATERSKSIITNRLSAMLGVEQSWMKSFNYSHFIQEFSTETENTVIELINNAVNIIINEKEL